MGPTRAEGAGTGGFAAGAQDWSKPVGTPPGTFTITAVPLFRMTRGGCELVQCGIRIVVDLDEEIFGPGRSRFISRPRVPPTGFEPVPPP